MVASARRNVRQVGPSSRYGADGIRWCRRILRMVAAATRCPRRSSSSWMRVEQPVAGASASRCEGRRADAGEDPGAAAGSAPRTTPGRSSRASAWGWLGAVPRLRDAARAVRRLWPRCCGPAAPARTLSGRTAGTPGEESRSPIIVQRPVTVSDESSQVNARAEFLNLTGIHRVRLSGSGLILGPRVVRGQTHPGERPTRDQVHRRFGRPGARPAWTRFSTGTGVAVSPGRSLRAPTGIGRRARRSPGRRRVPLRTGHSRSRWVRSV